MDIGKFFQLLFLTLVECDQVEIFFNLDLFEHPVKEFHLSLGVFAGQELAEDGAGLKKESYFVDFSSSTISWILMLIT